jgi:hypothetical protein
VQGDPRTQSVKLAGGTDAILLSAELVRRDQSRRATQLKLLSGDEQGVGWIVTGFVTAGRQSELAQPSSEVASRLRAHLLSLSLVRGKFEDGALREAYTTHGRRGSATTTAAPATQP